MKIITKLKELEEEISLGKGRRKQFNYSNVEQIEIKKIITVKN
jgi:hypothetical protein